MKTIKILPSINNIDFAGRVYSEPQINGNRMRFSLIRNFGGDKEPVILNFVAFKTDKKAFPEVIKKGAAVVVHAYFSPNVYRNKSGEEIREIQFIVKKAEAADLVEKKYEEGAPAPAADAEAIDIDLEEDNAQ